MFLKKFFRVNICYKVFFHAIFNNRTPHKNDERLHPQRKHPSREPEDTSIPLSRQVFSVGELPPPLKPPWHPSGPGHTTCHLPNLISPSDRPPQLTHINRVTDTLSLRRKNRENYALLTRKLTRVFAKLTLLASKRG